MPPPTNPGPTQGAKLTLVVVLVAPFVLLVTFALAAVIFFALTASARPRALEPRAALDLVRVQPLGAYGLPPTASMSRSSETPLLNSASPSRSKLIGSDRPRRTN